MSSDPAILEIRKITSRTCCLYNSEPFRKPMHDFIIPTVKAGKISGPYVVLSSTSVVSGEGTNKYHY